MDGHISPEERRRTAEERFLEGYNCCQAVLLAFGDITGMDEKAAAAIGSGFGGGFARMREVCGAVSAMTILAGCLLPADDPKDMARRTTGYRLVRDFADRFKAGTGSIICRDLLGLKAGNEEHAAGAADVLGAESPTPSARTPEYYRTRPCARQVGLAAEIVAQYIETQTTNN